MKKLIALLLAAVMLCCCGVSACAESVSDAVLVHEASASSDMARSGDDGANVIFIIGGAAVGIIIAVCIMMYHKGQLKSVRMERSARNYVEPGSFNITYSDEIYLYKKVDRTEKPKDNNG